MDYKKLAEELEKQILICFSVLKENSTKDPSESLVHFSTYKDDDISIKHIIIFNKEEYKLYYGPIELFLKQNNLMKFFSKEYIEERIKKLYFSLLDDNNLKDELDLLIKEFKKNPEEKEVSTELYNIILEDGIYNLIDCIMEVNNSNSEKIILKSKVKACDKIKYEQLALYNFQISIGFLRLFTNSCPKMKGSTFKVRHLKVDNNFSKCYINLYPPIVISTKYLNGKLKNIILDLTNNKSKFTDQIKHSIFWYNKGLNEETPHERIVAFVTSVECIMKTLEENGEITMKLSERIALFLSPFYKERIEIREDLIKIYKLRSKIIHSGDNLYEEYYSKKIEYYARITLMLFIIERKFFDTLPNFVERLDNLKLSGLDPHEALLKEFNEKLSKEPVRNPDFKE